jgi:hypothetical protein
MKFYVITNGYMGNGYCRVYVAAESDDRARELASAVFKSKTYKRREPYPEKYAAADSLIIEHCLDGSTEGAIEEVDN